MPTIDIHMLQTIRDRLLDHPIYRELNTPGRSRNSCCCTSVKTTRRKLLKRNGWRSSAWKNELCCGMVC